MVENNSQATGRRSIMGESFIFSGDTIMLTTIIFVILNLIRAAWLSH